MHIEENQFQHTLYVVFQTSRYPNLLSYYWSIKRLWHLKLFIQKITIWSRKWKNYYIIIQRKFCMWRLRMLGKSQALWAIDYQFALLWIKTKDFDNMFLSYNKLTLEVERTNQNQIPGSKMFEFSLFILELFKEEKSTHPPLFKYVFLTHSTICIFPYSVSQFLHI